MYWCFLLRCVPGMALMGRSDMYVLVFLAAECTWDGVDGEVGQSYWCFLTAVCTVCLRIIAISAQAAVPQHS